MGRYLRAESADAADADSTATVCPPTVASVLGLCMMAWGYWSATSVIPDRGRSPRRNASSASVAVSSSASGGDDPSEGSSPRDPGSVASASSPPPSPGSGSASRSGSAASGVEEAGSVVAADGLLSRRSSLEQPSVFAAVCGRGSTGSLASIRFPLTFQHQEHCELHQPPMVECHHELGASEDEDTDPGYATGT